jgi:hypothetical protein
MNRPRVVWLIGLVLLFCAVVPGWVTRSNAEAIGIVSQFGGDYPWTMKDDSPGVRTVYVVFESFGFIAVWFRIASGPGVTMVYLSETPGPGTIVGDTQSGMTVCFGSCADGIHLLATINYLAYGTSSPCSKLSVVPHPAVQSVGALTCESQPSWVDTQDLALQNANGTCICTRRTELGPTDVLGCNALPIRSSTWGAVKSLYR